MPSKLVAGGLSAAVVLLWWPRFFPADSVESWLGRGFVWTLCFELMMLSFRPLEAALWDTGAGRRLSGRARAARHRFDADSPVKRLGAAGAVAALAIAAPGVALLLGPPHRPQPAQVTRHVTEVRQIVRVVKRPVQVVAQAPAPAQVTPAAPVSTPRPSAATTRRRSASSNRTAKPKTPKRTPAPQPQHDSSTQPQQPAPAPTTTGGPVQAPVAG